MEPRGANRNLARSGGLGVRRTGDNYDHHLFLDRLCGALRPCRRGRDRQCKSVSSQSKPP